MTALLGCEVLMTKTAILEFVFKNWKAIAIVVLSLVVAMKSRQITTLCKKHTKHKTNRIKLKLMD